MRAILIIDDDEDIVGALELVLSDEGYAVASAHDHAGAMAAARRVRPALVIVDWNLPGVDTARLIGELRRATAARIVLATGANLDAQQARRLGADQLLRKPYSIDDLLSTAREANAAPAAP